MSLPKREPGGDLMGQSTEALDRHWGQLVGMYGQDSIAGAWLATLDSEQHLEHLAAARQATLGAVVRRVVEAASFARP